MTVESKTKPFVKGFKYRIYPTEEQKVYLAKIFGSCRFVYNHFLAKCIKEYEAHKADNTLPKPVIDKYLFQNELVSLKNTNPDYAWLQENPAHVINESVFDLHSAFTRFFKQKKGYPKFKSKHDKQTATFDDFCFRIKDNELFLAKCKTPFKVVWSREMTRIKIPYATISKNSAGQYFVSFTCQYTPEKTDGKGIVGIDLGISNLAVFSDGTQIDNPRHFVKAQEKLARLQQYHARKQKGSKNREKSRLKIAKQHQYIANQRADFLHKLSTKLVRENQAIVVESLKVSSMLKNHKLAKHIADASWSEFNRQLLYKTAASQHCKLLYAASDFPSTQICSCCRRRSPEKIVLGVKNWLCPYCGVYHDRDINAAINLRMLGVMNLSIPGFVTSSLAILSHKGDYVQYELLPSFEKWPWVAR